jgi:very-short-patch-repair endonuclease
MIRRLANATKNKLARRLRASAGATETALWKLLQRRQVAGFKFRRRAVVLGWIPDFWCASAKVAVEIDGLAYPGKIKRDARRDQVFADHGAITVHIPSDLVWHDPRHAVALIETALRSQNRSR